MDIKKTKNDTTLTLAIQGRIDTTTAPQLEAELRSGVEYISSAGLRVLLSAQKLMSRQGKMVLSHVNESVMEVFEVTGFSDILTIE